MFLVVCCEFHFLFFVMRTYVDQSGLQTHYVTKADFKLLILLVFSTSQVLPSYYHSHKEFQLFMNSDIP